MGTLISIAIGSYDFIAEKDTFGDLLLPFSPASLHIEEAQNESNENITKRYFSLSISQMKDVLEYTGHTLSAAQNDFKHAKENIVYIYRRVVRFSIFRLWGEKQVDLDFRDSKLILVGENGSGKTTILRILYETLACKWALLSVEDFDYIVLYFSNAPQLRIDKAELKRAQELFLDILMMKNTSQIKPKRYRQK